MEDPIRTPTDSFTQLNVGNITLDEFEPWLVFMLCNIGKPANGEVIEYPDIPPLAYQTIDKVTADKARPSRDNI
jgi:hypothetical protein